MKRMVKRSLVLILCLTMVLTSLPMSTQAWSGIELRCLAPEDWEECYVYWWDSFESCNWPGEPMTCGADGIWVGYVPEDTTNVIFGNGQLHSQDLQIPSQGGRLYFYAQQRWDFAPQPVQCYYVVGEAGLCGSEWYPGDPANQMVLDSDGLWRKTYENVPAGVYEFKVTGDTWEHSWGDPETGWNARVEVPQTGTVEITFDPETGYLSADVSGGEVTPVPGDRVKVYCEAPFYWYSCSVHWLGSNELCQWPGEEMTREPDGSYSAWIPADTQNLIFSYCQAFSPVLTMPVDTCTKYVVDWDEWVVPETVVSQGGPYYVTGESPVFGSVWDPCDPANQMVEEEEGYWVKTYHNAPLGCYRFKVTDGTWDNTWGDEYEEDGIYEFIPPGPGTFVVCFDEGTGEMSWSFTFEPGIPATYITVYFDAPADWEKCYVNWSGSADECYSRPGEPMTKGTDGLWSADIPMCSWDVTFCDGRGNSVYTGMTRDDRVVYVADRDTWEYYDKDIGDLADVRVVGSADWMGNWDPASEAGRMTIIGDGTYEARFENVQPGDYRLKVTQNHTWQNSWGLEGRAYEFTVNEPATVIVTFQQEGWDGIVKVDVLYEEDTTEEDMVTLYCQTPKSWDVCNVFWWGSDITCSWPGVPMVYSGDGIWCGDVPKDATNVIFNDGYKQTRDLEMPWENRTMYVVEARQWVVLGEGVETRDEFRVVGNADWMGNWDPANDAGLMEEVAQGVYKCVFEDVQPGEYELKITLNGTWDCCPGPAWNHASFTVSEACDVTVTLTLGEETGAIGVEGAGIVSGEEPEKDVYRVVGNADWMGNWDSASDAGLMEEASPGVYKCVFADVQPGDYELKVTQNGTWEHSWGDGYGNNYCFTISEACDVTVIFTLNGASGTIIVRSELICPGLGAETEEPVGDRLHHIGHVAWLYAKICGWEYPASDDLISADVNGDGKENVGDVALLYARVRGTEEFAIEI